MGRAAGPADGQHMPADARPAQYQMRDNCHGTGQCSTERDPKQEAFSQKIPSIGIGKRGSDTHRIVEQQHIDDGAHDDERHQGGEKRPQSEEANQHTVDHADKRPDTQRDDHHHGHGKPGDIEQRKRHDIAECEGRADREIDSASHHDDH